MNDETWSIQIEIFVLFDPLFSTKFWYLIKKKIFYFSIGNERTKNNQFDLKNVLAKRVHVHVPIDSMRLFVVLCVLKCDVLHLLLCVAKPSKVKFITIDEIGKMN